MITGFNTDIEHDGVVYHVQTEDKGLETPLILSLVYSGGAILASKRAPYQDLIASGFSDEALSERLKRQHKLICAAIHSGRINDLKKMGSRTDSPRDVELAPTAPLKVETIKDFDIPSLAVEVVPDPIESAAEIESEVVETAETVESAEPEPETELELEFDFHSTQEWNPPPPVEEVPLVPLVVEPPVEEVREESEPAPTPVQTPASAKTPDITPYTIYDPRRQQPVEHDPEIGLVITILDDEEFYAAETRILRVLVTDYNGETHRPLPSAAISIKILGTAFRPLLYSVKCERDGVATVETQIPQFNSGRAAVLIRAVVKDRSAELRRVIHPRR